MITGGDAPGATPDPLAKSAMLSAGAWLANYAALACHPAASGRWAWPRRWLVVALAGYRRRLLVFVVSGLGIAGVIGTMGVSLFPFLLPSSSHPASSLTVWDASSSHRTLWTMLIVVVLFLPIVLAYTSWVYHVLRGPVTPEHIRSDPDGHY